MTAMAMATMNFDVTMAACTHITPQNLSKTNGEIIECPSLTHTHSQAYKTQHDESNKNERNETKTKE